MEREQTPKFSYEPYRRSAAIMLVATVASGALMGMRSNPDETQAPSTPLPEPPHEINGPPVPYGPFTFEKKIKRKETVQHMNVRCTTIRRQPEDIMFGTACNDNAKAKILERSDKKWSYGVVAVNGIYKCGYFRPDILPRFTPRKNAETHCNNYKKIITLERASIFSRVNCPELLPGREGCRDGSAGKEVSPRCTDRTLYANYASDEPSPFNVFGTGQGGFSEPYGKASKLIHFRAELKATSSSGAAAVVRSQEWGLMSRNCIRTSSLHGGTVSEFTPDERNQILEHPVSGVQLLKLEARQQALRERKIKELAQ